MNIKRIVTRAGRGLTTSWAHAYLDDEMGTLMVVTDWGNWSHRWGLHGMPKGTAFSDFIFGDRTEFDYVARKLYSDRTDGKEWDEKATKRILRIAVAEWFRRGQCVAETCVEMMHEIADAETFDDLDRSGLLDVRPDDYVSKPSWDFLHLRDVILPALQRAYAESST